MGDTRWCSKCESEFQPGIATCPDCGVALVDEPPPPAEAPSTKLAGHEPVAYDLQDWPQENRDSLEWILGGQEIPFEWDAPGVLIVPEGRADEVEGFIDYLDTRGNEDTTATDDAAESLATISAEAVVGDEVPDAPPAAGIPTEGTAPSSGAELQPPLRWLESQLDELRRVYLEYRADLDPVTAFERALASALDDDSRARLKSVSAGDEDKVYGTGAGERARRALQEALERLAWTIPPGGTQPQAT